MADWWTETEADWQRERGTLLRKAKVAGRNVAALREAKSIKGWPWEILLDVPGSDDFVIAGETADTDEPPTREQVARVVRDWLAETTRVCEAVLAELEKTDV